MYLLIYLHLEPFMPVVPIHSLSNNICFRSIKPLDLAVVDHILIAEVLLVTSLQVLQLVRQEEVLFVLLFLPWTMGALGFLTMVPTSEPTYYTVALWDTFP